MGREGGVSTTRQREKRRGRSGAQAPRWYVTSGRVRWAGRRPALLAGLTMEVGCRLRLGRRFSRFRHEWLPASLSRFAPVVSWSTLARRGRADSGLARAGGAVGWAAQARHRAVRARQLQQGAARAGVEAHAELLF